MGYDYTITYKKGHDNLVADVISRVPKVEAQLLTLSYISSDLLEQIKSSYTYDHHLLKIIQQLKHDPLASPLYMLKDSVLYMNERIVMVQGIKKTNPNSYMVEPYGVTQG